jgi:hypothetical protein
MTRQELELKAKEFDSKLKRHPMSSEELQNVLCDFVEALRIHDVVEQSEQLKAFNCVNFEDGHEICKTQCDYCKRVKGF